MKSLLVTYDYPPIVSGIATVFYNVWKSLSPEECPVLAPKVEGCSQFDSNNRIKVFRRHFSLETNVFKKLIGAILLFVYTLQITRKEKIDLLICGQPVVIGLIGLVFNKLFNMPYHVWVYGGETIKFKNRRFFLGLLKSVLNSADMIITNSSYTTDEYRRFGINDEKLLRVTPAVDADQFSPGLDVGDLVKKHKLENNRVIMTAGRLVPRKGNDMVIRSLAKVVEEIPDVRYVILGDGPEKERLNSLACDLDVDGHVVFAGFVSDSDLPRYYNACDLYVLPNRETHGNEAVEGFGISFIEAGACGKPVIGGKSGGTCDSVQNGETGVLIDPEDLDVLSGNIVRILSDQDLAQRLGSRGRERVLEEFTWEIVSKNVENLLTNGEGSYVN